MEKILYVVENLYKKSRREIVVLAPRHATPEDAKGFVKMTDPFVRQDEDFKVMPNKTKIIHQSQVYHWTKQYGVRIMNNDHVDILREQKDNGFAPSLALNS